MIGSENSNSQVSARQGCGRRILCACAYLAEEKWPPRICNIWLGTGTLPSRTSTFRNAQNIINKKDQSLLLLKASKYQFVHLIAECVGWKKLWDNALDHGPSVIKGMKNLVRVITYPDHPPKKCPLCDTADLDKPTLAEHVITNHTKSDNSWSSLLAALNSMDPTFFSHVLCFYCHSVCMYVMPGRAYST